MKEYDVQSILIHVPFDKAVRYIADPVKLPEWTTAFTAVAGSTARMSTPAGSVDVELRVDASSLDGSVDWIMVFPDRSVARAFSRVIPVSSDRVVYTFVLTAPPAPLEGLEGALEQQSSTLREELGRLKRVLEQG